MTSAGDRLRRLFPPAILLLAVAAAHGRSVANPFVTYDDPLYVTGNEVVSGGLSAKGVAWAFRSLEISNWHPLTWLSHMADVSLFGLAPAGHHAVNVLLHCAVTLLLYFVLSSLTGNRGRSLAAAALFALHPLRVEVVAWVSERKELLCALFVLLAIHAYGRYAKRPSAGRYAAVAALFALALLSKPMAVTLPFLLLLLDYWPLRRFPFAPPPEGGETDPEPFRPASTGRLLLEKVPLLCLSAASSAVTWYAQQAGGSVGEVIPFAGRAENALVSVAAYLGKTVLPLSLSPYYPHPALLGESVPAWEWVGAAILAAAVSAFVVSAGRRRPFLPVGWFWFLGTLVPVLGLLQVGLQSMADRYTYLPSMGLSIAASWGLFSVLPQGERGGKAFSIAVAVVAVILGAASWVQTGYWRSSSALFERAVAAGGKSSQSMNMLGVAYLSEGRFGEAARALEESLRRYPVDAKAWRSLASCYEGEGRFDLAVDAYLGLLRITPEDPLAWNGLGVAYGNGKRYDLALPAFRKVTALDPGWGEGWYNAGAAAALSGERREAEEALKVLAPLDGERASSLSALLERSPSGR